MFRGKTVLDSQNARAKGLQGPSRLHILLIYMTGICGGFPRLVVFCFGEGGGGGGASLY